MEELSQLHAERNGDGIKRTGQACGVGGGTTPPDSPTSWPMSVPPLSPPLSLGANNDGGDSSTGIDLCNKWASLNSPLDDIFLTVVVPSYLTIPDLVRLSAVSRRYRELFRWSSQANAALSAVLRRDSMRSVHEGGEGRGDYEYINQLPTLRGNFSSLSKLSTTLDDPWLVAELQSASYRRRGLVHLNLEHNTVEENGLVQYRFQSRRNDSRENRRVLNRYIAPLHRRGPHGTIFVCFNETNENIYCHWIDTSGNLTIREGDCILPTISNTQDGATYAMRRGSFDAEERPSNVFCHETFLYHSFALCFQEGGPPFAIYQARRGWRVGGYEHCHAISILPRGQIEELHCNRQSVGTSLYQYDLFDQATGTCLPMLLSSSRRGRQDPHPELRLGQQGGVADGDDPRVGPNIDTTATATHAAASTMTNPEKIQQLNKDNARHFYGLYVPCITYPIWGLDSFHLGMHISCHGSHDEDVRAIYQSTFNAPFHGSLCFPIPLGEVIWKESKDRFLEHQALC